jgi:polysaccharide export outer membrane protein
VKITIFRWGLLIYILSLGLVAHADEPAYQLRQGDTLDISVWGDESLSREIHVLPDGSISFPLAGHIAVAGNSAENVARIIREKLNKYLPDPEVTVIVTGTAGSRIYILGKVKVSGPIALTGPMTILQALSSAGGFDKFADLNAIKILRKTDQGDKILLVDYEDLLNGDNLSTNYLLKPNDTILVP